MGRQISSETLKSIAGSVLAGAGLFVLRGAVEEATHLSQFGGAPGDGFGLWHFVMLAASLNQHQVVEGLVQAFVSSLWPLLAVSFVIAGAGLLWNAEKYATE